MIQGKYKERVMGTCETKLIYEDSVIDVVILEVEFEKGSQVLNRVVRMARESGWAKRGRWETRRRREEPVKIESGNRSHR
jgi:hypothetical protein